MAATINYDDPILNIVTATDGANAKMPVETRNFSRDRFSTITGTVAFDSSYVTGGYAVSSCVNGLAKFGLKAVSFVAFSHQGGYLISYDSVNDKIKVFQQSAATGALTEVPATTSLSTVPAVAFMAIGRPY